MPISRQQSFFRNLFTNLGLASSPKVFSRQTNKQGGRKTNHEPEPEHETRIREKKGTILTLSELQLRLLQLMKGGPQREASKGSNEKETKKEEKASARVARSQTLPARPVIVFKDTETNGNSNNTVKHNRIQSNNSRIHVFEVNNTSSHVSCMHNNNNNSRQLRTINVCKCTNKSVTGTHKNELRSLSYRLTVGGNKKSY